MERTLLRSAIHLFLALLLTTGPSAAYSEDLFAGVYESEARENFGTDKQGEYRIEVVALSNERYAATVLRNGAVLGRGEVFRCPESSESYLSGRPQGRAEVLCDTPGSGFLSYSENGIVVPILDTQPRPKGSPETEAQAPVKVRHHKSKYYARINAAWAIYGFRKIGK